MKLHEYQAKSLFAKHNVPVPKGGVASTPAEVKQQVAALGGKAVVKAQVHAGGRGKAGGVKVVKSPEEGETYAAGLLGKNLVTHQTGAQGVPVRKLLVEELMDIDRELYVSVLIDGASQMPLFMASQEGGMEIEEVAAKSPEKIIRLNIDPTIGFQPFMGRRLSEALNIKPEAQRAAASLFASLYSVLNTYDCSLVEVNPLVITKDNKVIALDAKLNLEDDSLFRHKDLEAWRDPEQEDPLDLEAEKIGVNYIKLDGEVGCMVNGAGLAMATMDVIKLMGSYPANFLDVGGSASEDQIKAAFKLLMSDKSVKKILVNIFGGILRCDALARGIIAACKENPTNMPIVVRMRGTNAEEGKRLLAESGLRITLADGLREAAQKALAAK